MSAGDESIIYCTDKDDSYVNLFDVFCINRCEETSPEDDCMIMCEQMLAVRVLAPGESNTMEWDGYFREVIWDYCRDGGGCYGKVVPPVGSYLLVVNAWDDIFCYSEIECFPDENGVVWMAEVTGISTRHTATLDVVQEDNITISITK